MSVTHKILTLLLLMGVFTMSQAQTIDYKFQSVFIYNFAKNIEWPTEYQSNNITIGIVGNAKVAKEMEAFFTNKAFNSKKLIVKSFASPSELAYCHILFVPTSNKNNFPQILEKVGKNPTLIVTEQEGWGKLGSNINFIITEEGKFKFELNRQATKERNLKITSDIVNLAILI